MNHVWGAQWYRVTVSQGLPPTTAVGCVLYNRSSFLDWIGHFVGLDYAAARRLRLGDDGRLPVVVLTGGHGSGRSAVLDTLASRYVNHTPLAHLDLAQRRFAKPPQGIAATGVVADEPPLIRLLHSAIWGLTPKTKDTRRLPLPRLNLALLVISLWTQGKEMTRVEAEQLLQARRSQVESLLSTRSRSRQLADEFMKDVGSQLADEFAKNVRSQLADVAPFPIDILLKVSLKVFMKLAFDRRERRRAVLRWWENHRPEQAGDGMDRVLATARDFHSGGAWRERAEGELVAALLADLDAAPGNRKFSRIRRPMLLIDNLHSDPAGPRFFDLVLQNRQRTTDPLILIGAALTYETRRWRQGRRVAIEEVAVSEGRMRLVELSPLRLDDTLEIFDVLHQSGPNAVTRPREDLPHLVHRLAEGLPLAVCWLAAAAVANLNRSGAVDLPRLLDQPVSKELNELVALVERSQRRGDAEHPVTAGAHPGSQPEIPVAEYLLKRLVPDDEIRDDLVLFAAAQDSAAARALADEFLNETRRGETVRRAEQFLRRGGFLRKDSGFFVGDRLLRTLLLHRLRTRGRAAVPGWAEVHAHLYAHYAPEPDEPRDGRLGRDEASRLQHALSLGNARDVADRLAAAFPVSDQTAWLQALVTVASASYGGEPAVRSAVAMGSRPAERDGDPVGSNRSPAAEQDGDPIGAGRSLTTEQRAIARLLHAAWYLNDPLTMPDTNVIHRLEEDLKVLAANPASDGQVYFSAAQEWPSALLEWRQDHEWLHSLGEES